MQPQLIKKRPLSPDVLEIDGKSPHYKFPLGAISSIVNRVTGVALSVGKHAGIRERAEGHACGHEQLNARRSC
jgi:hypothetical protein